LLYKAGESADYFYFVLQGGILLSKNEQTKYEIVAENRITSFVQEEGQRRSWKASASTRDTVVI